MPGQSVTARRRPAPPCAFQRRRRRFVRCASWCSSRPGVLSGARLPSLGSKRRTTLSSGPSPRRPATLTSSAMSPSPKWWRSGAPADGLHPGDRVVALWHVWCRRHDRSRRGVPTSCRRRRQVRCTPFPSPATGDACSRNCCASRTPMARSSLRRGALACRRRERVPQPASGVGHPPLAGIPRRRGSDPRGLRKHRFCGCLRGRPAGPLGSTTWIRTPRGSGSPSGSGARDPSDPGDRRCTRLRDVTQGLGRAPPYPRADRAVV
jgi:hypothetical protein